MSCRFARSLIAAYVEGQLDPARRWVVRRHLLACTACYEDYERSEAVGDLVERVGLRFAPSDLRVQIMSAVSRQSVRYQWPRWKAGFNNLMRPIAVPAAGDGSLWDTHVGLGGLGPRSELGYTYHLLRDNLGDRSQSTFTSALRDRQERSSRSVR